MNIKMNETIIHKRYENVGLYLNERPFYSLESL